MGQTEVGYLSELFTSIQGEGLWAGHLHHFVRLAGCGVGCRNCDTPGALDRPAHFFVHGSDKIENPIEPSALVKIVAAMDARIPGAQALAFTGGEPLEQVDFLERLLPLLKAADFSGRPVLLETAGLHAEAMARIVQWVDQVSMDIKLYSTSGLKDVMARHERFMAALRDTGFYVKLVVDSKTTEEEVADAARLVASANPSTPLFLQPAFDGKRSAGGSYLIKLWQAARALLRDVRIVPQLHRQLGLE
jgi:organic radical activating enzyme